MDITRPADKGGAQPSQSSKVAYIPVLEHHTSFGDKLEIGWGSKIVDTEVQVVAEILANILGEGAEVVS